MAREESRRRHRSHDDRDRARYRDEDVEREERRRRRRERERERERDRDRDPERDRRERTRERRHDPERERRRDPDRDEDEDRERRHRERERERERRRRARAAERSSRTETSTSASSSQGLSLEAIQRLNAANEKQARLEEELERKARKKRYRETIEEPLIVEKSVSDKLSRRERKAAKRRNVSGALLEEGDGRTLRGQRRLRGGGDPYDEKYEETYVGTQEKQPWSKKKKIGVGVAVLVVLLAIIIAVAVVVSGKKSSSSNSSSSSSSPSTVDTSDVPTAAKGTYLDPSTWYTTEGFNTTYTNETYGGLPIMGLNSSYSNSAKANSNTPALSKAWGDYTTTPARGVNLGGWLSLEPFITPSLFDSYSSQDGIVDEYTLCQHLGASAAASTIEEHYATFVTEQDLADIAAAGLDHVRIPYSYWAVTTYDGDPYVFRTSWRYLLRGIEWARKYGLRVNLDLHALPGSQNGWDHSGRQGPIGWFNGTDGSLNAQRSLDIHDQLTQFFAQDRYKNIIAFYGLANEPRMTYLNVTDVLNWTVDAYNIAQKNGLTDAWIVFGDGFRGLENWQGELQGYDMLLLDVHQYVIFNVEQIVFNHTAKVNYACSGWTEQAEQSQDTSTGFGPTMFAEWSQADTDCATNLNDMNVGNRWTGTYNTGNSDTQVLSPTCPTTNTDLTCECDDANADPSKWSDTYKQFLQMFAEAQMYSFEKGLGWFYWTWKTESAPQWSYQAGLAAGVLPQKAYEPSFTCGDTVPSFSGLPENY